MSSIVSSVTGQIGGSAGGAGLNFNAAGAPIQNPAQTAQANQLYGQAQQGLTNQAAFLQAVQAQNGLQNQSNVFNQLQNVAAGQGPNPAQAQLAQATSANTANQAALMAGQRGAGANVGLIARQVAQQGAQNQQAAAGQASTLQAQQSLGALGQLGQLSTNQANQLANATSAYTNATQAEQQNILNAIAQQNNAQVGMQSNINTANAGISQIAAQQQGQLLGGVMNAAGQGLSMLAEGGKIQGYDDGGQVNPSGNTQLQQSTGATTGPKSSFGQYIQKVMNSNQNQDGDNGKVNPPPPIQQGSQSLLSGLGHAIGSGIGALTGGGSTAVAGGAADSVADLAPLAMLAAKGGKVPALVSKGEGYLEPKDLKEVEKGKNPLEVAEVIPGKPKYPGNDYRNDTVKKELKSGGVVLPNSVMQSKNPAKKAHKFVAAIMAKNGKSLPKKSK